MKNFQNYMVSNDALPTSHRELKSVFSFIVTYIHEHNHNIKFVTFHFSPVLFPFTAEDFNLPRTIQTSIFLARIHEHFNIKFPPSTSLQSWFPFSMEDFNLPRTMPTSICFARLAKSSFFLLSEGKTFGTKTVNGPNPSVNQL